MALLASSYFDRRASGPLTVTARSPAGTDETRARTWLEAAHGRLVAAGVPASSIRLGAVRARAADAVTVRYQRYTAVVAELRRLERLGALQPPESAFIRISAARSSAISA